jgi:hypothetical protein
MVIEVTRYVEGLPDVRVDKFTGFYTISLCSTAEKYIPVVKLFINTPQELVNFKNKLLWAFENPKTVE